MEPSDILRQALGSPRCCLNRHGALSGHGHGPAPAPVPHCHCGEACSGTTWEWRSTTQKGNYFVYLHLYLHTYLFVSFVYFCLFKSICSIHIYLLLLLALYIAIIAIVIYNLNSLLQLHCCQFLLISRCSSWIVMSLWIIVMDHELSWIIIDSAMAPM